MRRRRLLAAGLILAAGFAVVAALRGGDGANAPAPLPVRHVFEEEIERESPSQPPVADGGFLRGTVLGADGRPAAGSEVRVLAGGTAVASIVTESDGAFRLGPLRPGELLLVARRGGLSSEALGPIPLAPAEELDGLTLHLLPGASLAGIVLDAETSAPLEGAVLRAAGLVSRTDPRGRFLLEGLAPGEIAVRAGAEGYEPRDETLSIGSGPTSGVEIRLTKGVRLAGAVLDGAGRPVPGASLFTIVYRMQDGERRLAGRTLGDGTFSLSAPAGQVLVEAVDASGGTGRTGILTLRAGSERTGLEIRIAEAASLAGNVLDPAGEPVAGASVYATAGERTWGGVATARDGTFTIGGIPPGPIQVVAVSGGARARVGPLEILEGETAHVTLQLGVQALRGRVVDAGGRAAPGASVAVWPEGGARTLATVVRADGAGVFSAEGLPGGPLRVEASLEGLRGERRGVLPADGDVTVTLFGGELVGVVLRDGKPVTEFAVAASPLDPGTSGATVRSFFSADGRFRLALPPGEWEVRASAPATTEAVARAVVPDRGRSAEVALELWDGGAIEGRVVGDDGAPIEGARVSVERGAVFAFARSEGAPGSPLAVTAADGSFRLSGVEPGRVPVFAFRPGYRFARPVVVSVEPGRAATAELRLSPGDPLGEEVFGGIGLTLGMNRERAVIAGGVVPGGPAFLAGVRRGDVVAAVDGAPIPPGEGLRAAVDRIRGQVGTPVTLDLVRDGVRFRVVAVRAELRY